MSKLVSAHKYDDDGFRIGQEGDVETGRPHVYAGDTIAVTTPVEDRRLTLREFIDSERRSTDKGEWKDLGIGIDEAKAYTALRIYDETYWIAEGPNPAGEPGLYLCLGHMDDYYRAPEDIGELQSKLYTYARLAWGA